MTSVDLEWDRCLAYLASGLATDALEVVEHALVAPFAGTVAELAVREGQQVAERALLARIDPD